MRERVLHSQHHQLDQRKPGICSVEVIICMTFDLSVSICGEFYAMSVYDFKESSASRTRTASCAKNKKLHPQQRQTHTAGELALLQRAAPGTSPPVGVQCAPRCTASIQKFVLYVTPLSIMAQINSCTALRKYNSMRQLRYVLRLD